MENNVHYPKSYDIIYRAGYVIGFAGIVLFVYSYIFSNTLGFLIGIPVFYAGTLISSLFLLVWRKEIKIFILSCVISGIIAGISYTSAFNNTEVMVVSMGLVLAGLAGLYGKEAFCFHFMEGWILMWSFPILIFANLLAYGLKAEYNPLLHGIFSAIYVIAAILALSFLIKKLRQPLLHICQG